MANFKNWVLAVVIVVVAGQDFNATDMRACFKFPTPTFVRWVYMPGRAVHALI